MTTLPLPKTAAELTPELLTQLIGETNPGATVTDVNIVEAKTYGQQMVSTAGRAVLDVTYGAGSPAGLPTRLVVKMARVVDTICAPFYANEVRFYTKLRPELTMEAPRTLGGWYDPETTFFAIILEDLLARSARFPNVTQSITRQEIEGLLDTVAALHARYWQSPRFKTDLAWMETHVEGPIAEMMNGLCPAYIQHEIDNERFKNEMLQRLRITGPELLAGVQAVQKHQSTLAQTVLHGDTHLGNTYLLPGGRCGLLDWQLMVRGYPMHDVHYLIVTALSIETRRAEERDLLAFYLDRLAAQGVTNPPSFEETWLEYRRAIVWGLYIGWLTTPVVNYGWEINVLNHLRLTTAFEDHDTFNLLKRIQLS